MDNKRQGVALTTTLMALMLLFLVGASMVTLGSSNLSLSNSQANSERALYVAEAGLADMMTQVANGNIPGAPVDGVMQGSPTQDSYRVNVYTGPVTVPGTEVTVPAGYYYILSTGTARSDISTARAQARVGALVTRSSSGFQMGALIKDHFRMEGGRMVAWDSSSNAEVSGRNIFALLATDANQGVVDGTTAQIAGKAFVQQSSDPNQVFQYTGAASVAQVLGGVTALPQAMDMPEVSIPLALNGTPAAPLTVGSSVDLVPGIYSSLQVTPGGVATLGTGDYVFADITVQNAGQLKLADGSKARVFIQNALTATGDNAIANENRKPDTLSIYYLGAGSVTLNGGNDAYFGLAAPAANVVLDLVTGGLHGALTAKELVMKQGNFFYDVSVNAGSLGVSPEISMPIQATATNGGGTGLPDGAVTGGGDGTGSEPGGTGTPESGGSGGTGLVVISRQRL